MSELNEFHLGPDALFFFLRNGQKKIEDLTPSDIDAFAKLCGAQFDIDEANAKAIVALLRGEDVHTVAQIAKTPTAIAQVLGFVRSGLAGLNAAARANEDAALINSIFGE